MAQNFTKNFDVVKLLTETCMEKIFGKRWEVCECLEDDWNMTQVYEELASMFNKLSIESPIWITMLVRSLGGKIKFDKPYLFRGKTNIYGLEYDNDCGLTFACCADGDNDFYIEDEFTWAEAQEFIQFLSGTGDDVNKSPYLNSIFFTLKNNRQAMNCYDFDCDGDRVITDDAGREIEVRSVFITKDDKNNELVGINYTIKGEGDDWYFDFLLHFDLDFIKQLFKVFTEQIYGKGNYGQIVGLH